MIQTDIICTSIMNKLLNVFHIQIFSTNILVHYSEPCWIYNTVIPQFCSLTLLYKYSNHCSSDICKRKYINASDLFSTSDIYWVLFHLNSKNLSFFHTKYKRQKISKLKNLFENFYWNLETFIYFLTCINKFFN